MVLYDTVRYSDILPWRWLRTPPLPFNPSSCWQPCSRASISRVREVEKIDHEPRMILHRPQPTRPSPSGLERETRRRPSYVMYRFYFPGAGCVRPSPFLLACRRVMLQSPGTLRSADGNRNRWGVLVTATTVQAWFLLSGLFLGPVWDNFGAHGPRSKTYLRIQYCTLLAVCCHPEGCER